MTWTIDGFDTGALDVSDQSPAWLREPRITELELAGTGKVEFHKTGYGPYVVTLPCFLESTASATYAALQTKLGTQVTLSDGTSSWSSILVKNSIVPKVGGIAGYEGSLELRRTGT